MIEAYRGFFAASAGASAAFIGLLFVALSFIDSEKIEDSAKNWRRIIANSAFSQLINIFFVSMAGLLPDAHDFAMVGCVMAILGIIASFRLLPQTIDRQRTGRNAPTILGIAAVGAYVLQLVTGIGLLRNPDNKTLFSYFILSIFILYAGALARAWVNRSMAASRSPLLART